MNTETVRGLFVELSGLQHEAAPQQSAASLPAQPGINQMQYASLHRWQAFDAASRTRLRMVGQYCPLSSSIFLQASCSMPTQGLGDSKPAKSPRVQGMLYP
eukprot:4396041-Amphidinium_carterae.1